MIEIEERTHEVVRYEPAGRMTADDLNLLSIEARNLLGRIAKEIHPMNRIEFGHRLHRQVDLVERAIRHAPEPIAPRLVQRRDIAVPRAQPRPESSERRWRIGPHRVMTAVLVVRLPLPPRVPPIAYGERSVMRRLSSRNVALEKQ
jgi:hypothetical protein